MKINQKNLIKAINLFEKEKNLFVNNIEFYSKNKYIFQTEDNLFMVDVALNTVTLLDPDEFD